VTASEEAGQELGPYTEVSDGLILEAVDRAVHHEQDEVLTPVLAERLESGRDAGEVDDLPESPQHRAWRHARVKAAVRIEGFRQDLNDAVAEANRLLDQFRPVLAREWFEVSERLGLASWRLATSCLTEWPEPGDAYPDMDENLGLKPGRRATWAPSQEGP
jgi:hypothetical protein